MQTCIHEIANRMYRLSTCVPALAAEELFHATVLSPATGRTIRRLPALEPQMLALMHGSSTRTRCGEALNRPADAYDSIVQQC